VDDDFNGGYAAEADQWNDYKAEIPDYPPPPIDYPPTASGYPPYPPSQQRQAYPTLAHPHPQRQYTQQSNTTTDDSLYEAESEYGSTAHLVQTGGGSRYGDSQASLALSVQQHVQYPPSQPAYLEVERQPAALARPNSGLAYDDEPDYLSYYHQDDVEQGQSRHGLSGGAPRGGHAV